MHLMYQIEHRQTCVPDIFPQGMCCPTTMTFAAVPALAAAGSDAIQEAWMPRLTARAYDGRNVPITEKRGVTLGMSMTEKQATPAWLCGDGAP